MRLQSDWTQESGSGRWLPVRPQGQGAGTRWLTRPPPPISRGQGWRALTYVAVVAHVVGIAGAVVLGLVLDGLAGPVDARVGEAFVLLQLPRVGVGVALVGNLGGGPEIGRASAL